MDSVCVRKALVLLVGAAGLWAAGTVGAVSASAADPGTVAGLRVSVHVANATVDLGTVPDDDRWESTPV